MVPPPVLTEPASPRDGGGALRSVSLWQPPQRYSLHIAANGQSGAQHCAGAARAHTMGGWGGPVRRRQGPSGGGAELCMRRPQTMAFSARAAAMTGPALYPAAAVPGT